jgi:hypothetical protein
LLRLIDRLRAEVAGGPTARDRALTLFVVENGDRSRTLTDGVYTTQAAGWAEVGVQANDPRSAVMSGVIVTIGAPSLVGDDSATLAFPVGTSCVTGVDGRCSIGVRSLGKAGSYSLVLSAGAIEVEASLRVSERLKDGVRVTVRWPARPVCLEGLTKPILGL